MDKEQIVAFIKLRIQMIENDLAQVSQYNTSLHALMKGQILVLSQVLEFIELDEKDE